MPTVTKFGKKLTMPLKDLLILDKGNKVVTNPFTGESCLLCPEAVAVYDFIKGCEISGNYENFDKCRYWFAEHFPDEYMILLD